jgi:hypothetical protein
MKLIDLYEFPNSQLPSPYQGPVFIHGVGKGYLPDGFSLKAVGWIEDFGFPTGQVPDTFIELLIVSHTEKNIFSDGTRGIHTCTLCNQITPHVEWKSYNIRVMGHGHYLVQKDKTVFMAPELILHYLLDHQYCPPEEFVQSVLHGKFLEENNLVIERE